MTTNRFRVAAARTALLLSAIMIASACHSAEKEMGMFALYNFSGKTAIAPIVSDTAGNQGVFEQQIGDKDVWFPGRFIPFRGKRSVTLQWIAGEGRARWYTVTLPVKLEQDGGTFLEIYLRPDQFVCASLVDKAHVSNRSDADMQARMHQDRSQLSCAQPVALPRLMPGMATGFEQDTQSHSWQGYDHGGTTTLTNATLTHRSGAVSLRYGLDYKDRPYFLNEFKSLRMLGANTAWLAEASVRPAESGFFIITGDKSGWQSRFLGNPGETTERLTNDRIVLGRDSVVVDTKTADVFMLPHDTSLATWTLGQSPDGKYLALYWETMTSAPRERDGLAFNFVAIDLETGKELAFTSKQVPPVPNNVYRGDFYTAWYRQHCTWKPQLACQ